MNKKYRKRKVPKYFFIVSLILFLSIGVGYSVIYSNLSLQGNITKKANTWNILFQNPVFDEGSITTPLPTITGGTNMTMNVNLTAPGQKYAFVVDLTNNGNVPAIIKTLNIAEISEEQAKYLRWKVEYEDESIPAVGDVLKAGETKKLHILLEYKKLRATDFYPKDNVNLNLSIAMNYYLPEETYNTVTLTKNESTKTIQVSNLEQETTLTDILIESNDQVIACNNGVEPSTNNENQIVLNKVKQNATCRIETSLAKAVTNSNNEKSFLTILANNTTNEKVTVSETQDIKVDLNGKKYIIDLEQDTEKNIEVNGKLTIEDTKGNAELETLDEYLIYNNNNSVLNILGGKYSRDCSSTVGAVLSGGGVAFLKNSTFTLYNSNVLTIYTRLTNAVFNLDSCIIDGQQRLLGNWGPDSILNIKNSTISSSRSALTASLTDTNGYTYICNSRITAGNSFYDIEDINDSSKVFYSSDTIFKSGNNIPSLANGNINNLIRSDIACAE